MIKQNPFNSQTFTNIWCNHFYTNKRRFSHNALSDISFFKPYKRVPFYINIGKNLTKGISYFLKNNPINNSSKDVYLIYDVPQYFKINTKTSESNLGLKKIKQYPGFLINLENYTDFKAYQNKTFSKSSNQKLNRYTRRLEQCFDIREKLLIGNVEKTEYDRVFKYFEDLLTKRFDDKQITNNNLHPKEWRFYYEVAYQLMLEHKAALYVIYNKDTPISVRLLYFSDTVIFDAITVFDIDYMKFHLGKVSILKMLEWSFKSEYKIFDFSKGYFDYKESWSDVKYDFEYHIVYNTKSLQASWLAALIALAFKTKQYLRDKKIHEKLHKVTFLLKKSSKATQRTIEILENYSIDLHEIELQEITLTNNLDYLKRYIIDFQFLNSEHQKNLKLYQIQHSTKNLYVIKGETNQQIVEVTQ